MCGSLAQVTSQSPHPKQQAFAISSLPLSQGPMSIVTAQSCPAGDHSWPGFPPGKNIFSYGRFHMSALEGCAGLEDALLIATPSCPHRTQSTRVSLQLTFTLTSPLLSQEMLPGSTSLRLLPQLPLVCRWRVSCNLENFVLKLFFPLSRENS